MRGSLTSMRFHGERVEMSAAAELKSYERMVGYLPEGIESNGEMENILDGRDLIEESMQELSPTERDRLRKADSRLRKYAAQVDARFGEDIRRYRERATKPADYWWWFPERVVRKSGVAA